MEDKRADNEPMVKNDIFGDNEQQEADISLDERQLKDLENAFDLADSLVLKKYLYEIQGFPIRNSVEIEQIAVGGNVCFYHIDRLVYDKQENIHDKLVTVYSSICSEKKENSLVLLVRGEVEHIDFYIGVVTKSDKDTTVVRSVGDRFNNLLLGQFPGTQTSLVKGKWKDGLDNEKLIDNCFYNVNTVASVSGVANLRNQNEIKSNEFVQGMEKLVDSMRGRTYTAIYIADAMKPQEIDALCSQYEDLYATLSPFKESIHTLSKNDSISDTKGTIEGIVNTTNENVAHAMTHGTMRSKTNTDTVGGSVGASTGVKVFGIGANVNVSANYSHSWSRTEGESDAKTDTKSYGTAKSLTSQNSVANAITKGSGESLQIKYDNRAVRTLLERIDEQIQRLRTCGDFGVFNSCVYFLSNQYADAVAAATAYQSLIRGENSSVEASAINIWTGDGEAMQLLLAYLQRFYHPEFGKEIKIPSSDDEQNANPASYFVNVSPAVLVSGKELSYQFSMPKKSISGLPVIEKAAFGRDVVELHKSEQGYVDLGNIYHMGNVEGTKDETTDLLIPNVKLSIQELAAHTFITGSTGSGKSNTVYQILSELKQQEEQKTFLVIEPAKGEYASVLGGEDVSVFGTNPKKNVLLRINPFSFPEDIHVLEHLERLASIFNVCWPMYAAMPAILKDAMERAYIDAGWDLRTSENKHNNNLFPTFEDVLRNIKKVLDESDYSADNKGDYTGALVTRLRALTNGLYGMIFSSDEISNKELFDKNVIIDLSRVGSNETKSLIMGLLVLKLSEYRMSTHTGANEKLKHVTVLEEAHNILKRTSTEQMSESANLVGKSVEMLSNAIAEMRTYGEGFIIADQSPGNMDMSVIRNTNTKIIMRLPDYSDRELVGRAASLNDEQIAELSKLERGVAAVIQGNWLEAVLCKVKKFESTYTVASPSALNNKVDDFFVKDKLIKELVELAATKHLDETDLLSLKDAVLRSNLTASIKRGYMEIIDGKTDEKVPSIRKIIYELLDAEKITRFVNDTSDIVDIRDEIANDLHLCDYVANDAQRNIVIGLILYEQSERNPCYNKVFQLYTERLRGGLL